MQAENRKCCNYYLLLIIRFALENVVQYTLNLLQCRTVAPRTTTTALSLHSASFVEFTRSLLYHPHFHDIIITIV
jgi:hypothetical protein